MSGPFDLVCDIRWTQPIFNRSCGLSFLSVCVR